jgi:hypothetical protein
MSFVKTELLSFTYKGHVLLYCLSSSCILYVYQFLCPFWLLLSCSNVYFHYVLMRVRVPDSSYTRKKSTSAACFFSHYINWFQMKFAFESCRTQSEHAQRGRRWLSLFSIDFSKYIHLYQRRDCTHSAKISWYFYTVGFLCR